MGCDQFFEGRKVASSASPTLFHWLCDYFLSSKLKFTCQAKSQSARGSAIHQCMRGIPLQNYKDCFKKLDQMAKTVWTRGEYLNVLEKLKSARTWQHHGHYLNTPGITGPLVCEQFSAFCILYVVKPQKLKCSQDKTVFHCLKKYDWQWRTHLYFIFLESTDFNALIIILLGLSEHVKSNSLVVCIFC